MRSGGLGGPSARSEVGVHSCCWRNSPTERKALVSAAGLLNPGVVVLPIHLCRLFLTTLASTVRDSYLGVKVEALQSVLVPTEV